MAAQESPSANLTLGAVPIQLLQLRQFDMWDVPDMHVAGVQQADKSYRVFMAGVIGPGGDGSTGMLVASSDFMTYRPGVGTPKAAKAVLSPSCHGATYAPECVSNWDADYAGANTVLTAANGKDLLMIYQGETRTFGTTTNQRSPFYAEIGVARSTDNGVTWGSRAAIISGTEKQGSTSPGTETNGVPEPGAIVANNFIYVFYPYFRQATSPPGAGPAAIQVARAPVVGDGAPGTWTKYFNGSFGSEPGLGGRADQVVPTVSACSGPQQPWVTFSAYLKAHVLVFVCNEGWFYSTSTDPSLVKWTAPVQFYAPRSPLFTKGEPNDDHLILVTPGNPMQVIDQAGLVLYAHTPSFGVGTGQNEPQELWCRTFTFGPAKDKRP
jgi:hypothetical protein